jgi:hypothetical protein
LTSVGHVEIFEYSLLLPDGKRNSRAIIVCGIYIVEVGVHWGDPGVDGRIILGWIFGKWDVGVWIGWS